MSSTIDNTVQIIPEFSQAGGNVVTRVENSDIALSIAQGGAGRHETFPPRYGWLKKGFDAVSEDPDIFKEDYSIVKLGVGKNMVRAIRSWCLAFKLIVAKDRQFVPSAFGERLLNEKNGWDPYLEDDASLWLLHWQLFVPPFEAVSWPLAFNYCSLSSFDSEELSRIVYNAAQAYPTLARISNKTYQRDASCIIRMYVDPEEKNSEIESPFSQLGLILKTGERNQFTFNTRPKLSLPSLIVAAACFSYMESYFPERQGLYPFSIWFGTNSPGCFQTF